MDIASFVPNVREMLFRWKKFKAKNETNYITDEIAISRQFDTERLTVSEILCYSVPISFATLLSMIQ
jgi:hypothetical protein